MSANEDAEKAFSDSQAEPVFRPRKWGLGILNDKQTDEVPGSVVLMSKASGRQEPLGLHHTPARASSSSLPSPLHPAVSRRSSQASIRARKKRTPDGEIILEPQPDDSMNDPLNWPEARRNASLLSLGFYCMLGGGMTPILAAGFNDVASTYNVTIPKVALTTGLYMLGLGVGSVVFSPTAILFGKRPVYLSTAIAFILSSVWCALSPNYASLVVARIVQGIAVSPVECLPSASIAEIFFIHERGYRLGVYSLLLLGGKNLMPLISAAIIESLGWRWVFWIIAIFVGFSGSLLFLFVPETFWDRTPRPKLPNPPGHESTTRIHLPKFLTRTHSHADGATSRRDFSPLASPMTDAKATSNPTVRPTGAHVAFDDQLPETATDEDRNVVASDLNKSPDTTDLAEDETPANISLSDKNAPPNLPETQPHDETHSPPESFTDYNRHGPPRTYLQTLRPYNGRLCQDSWFRVAIRPFILFAYPAVLWSAVVYSLSVGWLIVLSESMTLVYKNRATYNFNSLQTGLVYLSPFVGGVLGTAVAGKVSDLIVRFMARRNDGVYEPEFRLVMGLPIAISTTIGLMGFGWSVEERDHWIVPTVFFGVISFGCSLGATTSITFCVDSYRQYAGEALVTLNFSKNVLHGFIFSLFFTSWLEKDGPKTVFVAIGGVQMFCLFFTIPLYIYGKRARMWTVRQNLMERF